MSRAHEYRIVYRGDGYMPQVRGGWWPFWRDLSAWELMREAEAENWIRLIAEQNLRQQRKGVVRLVHPNVHVEEAPPSIRDVQRCRQWFDYIQDTNPDFLTRDDYVLAQKLYEQCCMRVPKSIEAAIARQRKTRAATANDGEAQCPATP